MDLTTPNKTDFSKLTRKPNLGSYTDYRTYLNDYYQFRRTTDPSKFRPYSYAHFSAAANIKSPNYLKLIIDGKRNLSKEMVKKFATALNLAKKDSLEFEALVNYCQAKDPLERNNHLKTLSEIRIEERIHVGEIDQKSVDEAPSWLSWVLLSLCDQKNVDLTVDNIKKSIKRNLSPQQIEKSLKQLLDNDEIEFDHESKTYSKKLNTNHDAQKIPPEMVRKLQSELIYLGSESLFQDQPEDREFGTVSLCLTKKEFDELKFELRHLRKKIYKDNLINREDSKGDQVFQLNIQLFPLTESIETN
ncbi:MAG: TIGR02147 family protein [Bdellovibrionaceae bacterium]|nr:TIGR02147 family protein [Pseudobdellovibrionaceae bacterium]